MQIGQHIRLKCFAPPIAICNNLSIKNLNKFITVIISVKIRSWIYENIQLNAIYKRCVMELLVVIRNNQRIKITVQIVCSVGIRAVKDDRKRIVFVFYVFNYLFQ